MMDYATLNNVEFYLNKNLFLTIGMILVNQRV
jgi:hypothetical protein